MRILATSVIGLQRKRKSFLSGMIRKSVLKRKSISIFLFLTWREEKRR